MKLPPASPPKLGSCIWGQWEVRARSQGITRCLRLHFPLAPLVCPQACVLKWK